MKVLLALFVSFGMLMYQLVLRERAQPSMTLQQLNNIVSANVKDDSLLIPTLHSQGKILTMISVVPKTQRK